MNAKRKNHLVAVESANPLIEALYERRLTNAVRRAREFRREGFKGAALFEFLALLYFQSKNELMLAHELAADLRSSDLYFFDEFGLPESQRLLRIAPWILQQELPVLIRNPGFNPSKRLELLCALERDFEHAKLYRRPESFAARLPAYEEMGLKRAELQSWLARLLTSIGDVRGAFPIIRECISSDPDTPSVRRAGHLLFSAVPARKRYDVLNYSPVGIRSFGAAPVENLGFILKEFCGTSLSPSSVYETAKPLSPIQIAEWEEGWTAASPGQAFSLAFEDFMRRQGVENTDSAKATAAPKKLKSELETGVEFRGPLKEGKKAAS